MTRCLPFCIVVLASLMSVPFHAQSRTNAKAHGRARPNITNLSPSSGPVGTSVIITGSNFGTAGTATFNRIAATPTSWSATSIVAGVPAGATTGNVVVTVGGVASNGVSFAVTSSTSVVATPTFNPGAGTYSSAQTVTISSTTSGATICYTTDGSNPAATIPGLCSAGTSLANGGKVTISTSETLKAIGTEGGLTNSAVGSASFTISVAPVFTSGNNTTFTVGTAGSFTATATGTPTPVLTESGALPSGVNFKDNGNGTATLSGTPAAGTGGAYTLTLTASNGVGTPANQSFTLTVSTCVQELAIGNFELCGEVYNDVSAGTSVKVNYSPSSGNAIIAWATWCFNSSCNSLISGVTATIGDNINATESCFFASPHSPFITNANGGAQGSGDFQQHYVWYCPGIPSGVTSFTVTPSNPNLNYLQLNITEWKAGSLAASCSPISACFENVDNFGQAGNSTGTTATISTSGPTVNANDLIFAVTEVPCCIFTASPGTGYSGITVAPSVTPGMVSEAKAASSTGIQTATTTWTGGSTHWFGVIVPLISAGGVSKPIAQSISSLSPTGLTKGESSKAADFNAPVLTMPSQAQVLTAIEKVNDYWIANNMPASTDGAQATYFEGDLAAYDATGQANYLRFAQAWASEHYYSLDGGNNTTDANYQAAGQVYIRLYELDKNSSYISGITQSINGMVNGTVDNEWTWVDAINMSMPDFAALGAIYNETTYYTKMYSLYSYTKYSLGLFDSVNNLWWENRTYANTSTYWSRGNGWVFAAHAKVLSVLPTSDPHYAEYLATFKSMAAALAARQQPGGYWNSDLGGIDDAGPESSGTSLFLYGIAWGLDNGILDRASYLPIVEKAWNFLANTAIQPSGRLGYVQPAGSGPGTTTATTTEDFGVGAFLRAARQMELLTH